MNKSNKPRTLSIGGATFDLFARIQTSALAPTHGSRTIELPIGGKIPVDRVIEACGGGASNTGTGGQGGNGGGGICIVVSW